MLDILAYRCYNNKGYIALISVVIIGAVTLAISVSVLLLGLASSRSSFTIGQSMQAGAAAQACAEEALENIRKSSQFSGTDELSIGLGVCSYEVVNNDKSTIINVSGTVGTVVRKLQIVISEFSPLITCASWQEVEKF